ncbi:MAG: hypothetical protein ACE5GA_07605 [Candidatus Zixiibacteriota bacterium]
MIILSERRKRLFALFTDLILTLTLLALAVGFVLYRIPDGQILAERITRGAVILALLSTPLRLLALGHLLRLDGRLPDALVALALVGILTAGGLIKWFVF